MTPEASANDGWEDHRRWQVRSRLTTTAAQRLAWLERAIAFARMAGALPGEVDPPQA